MSTKPRRDREKNKRRIQILDAAERVIHEKGFETATMDEIAAEAELSKGTLYLYFSDKSELHIAISKRGLEILRDKFQDVLKKDLPGIELVYELGKIYINFVNDHPWYTRALIYYESLISQDDFEESKYTRECEEVIRQLLMYLTRSLQIGMQDGSVSRQENARLLALQIAASLRGMIQLYQIRSQKYIKKIMDGADVNLQTMMTQFIEILLRGIEATDQTKKRKK